VSEQRPDARIRRLGLRSYEPVWEEMRRFTGERDERAPDEFWLVEHEPVFTLGRAGRPEHLLAPGDIPVVQTDRGGQVTYHGPGQAILYLMIDLPRLGIGVRQLVSEMEGAVIDLLADHEIAGESRPDAPGVYVRQRKIASLGLRIQRGRTYHGIALNVDLDLGPFLRINPCGYPGLEVTSMRALDIIQPTAQAGEALLERLFRRLGYAAVWD